MYILVGWQDDDLPIFGRIQYIVVISGKTLFGVFVYRAYGIDHHYHSFLIDKTGEVAMYWLTQLADYQPLQAHLLRSGCLCITFRSHIENMSN